MRSCNRPLILGAALAALLPMSSVGSPQLASATTIGPQCQAQLIGLTPSERLRVVSLSYKTVTGSAGSATSLPYSPIDLLPRSTERADGVQTTYLMAVHPSGLPRIIRARTSGSGFVAWTSRLYEKKALPFSPRLATESYDFPAGRNYIYAVSSTGTLQRWNDGLTAVQGVGRGYENLTTLAYAGRYSDARGRKRDVLYATTASGGLAQIQVPLQAVADESTTKLRSSGFEGVSELVAGTCGNTYGQHDDGLVALRAAEGTATLTRVNRRESPTWQTTHPLGAVGVGHDWNLHAVSWFN